MKKEIFISRESWRQWLAKKHEREKDIWVVFYKKHSGKRTFTYNEAVEEAICFGWIDGILKRVDDETYMQKFMPRGKTSQWSEMNLKRAKLMINEGKMTPAGQEKLGDALEKYEKAGIARRPPRTDDASPHLMALLKNNPAAWVHFQKLAPSYRRQYLGWVMSAKKEETRVRRMEEVVAVLAKGKKLGLK